MNRGTGAPWVCQATATCEKGGRGIRPNAKRLQTAGAHDAPGAWFDAFTRTAKCEERIRGSHHMFRKTGVEEKTNLQREGSKAKAYQVRQVRATCR